MKNSNRDRFDGRLKSASEAKQHRLERFKAAADDPQKLARRAERDAVAAAREAERKARAIKLLREKEDLVRAGFAALPLQSFPTRVQDDWICLLYRRLN